ncbi:thiamine phosphate synthase [Ahrensia sp. R2A130]|uniref:thiamine phosphate synthase n=1 Tax=Ahrensia sp. R2A130 TaxID=744979 RepID=UPI0001E0A4A5|nr:thiamine phosphate synthase [Ahrensia sp. R2A130]EFL88644.1 thiamine-phosphate pyrophosphorylase [Ahrensia sp. R2A130]
MLVRHGDALARLTADDLAKALSCGDVASLILSPVSADGIMDETAFQTIVEPLVPVAQAAGIAVIIEHHSRVAGRLGADGLQLGQDPADLADAVSRLTPAMMVGAANVKTRHNALVLGEIQPDYIMFGKTGSDIRDEANPKNVALGDWWSKLVELPCIVLGGASADSVLDVAKAGVEFVALDAALDGVPSDDATIAPQPSAMGDAIARANQLLDEHAPRFDAENS